VTRVTSCSVRGGATPLIVPNPFGCTSLPLASKGRLVIVRSVRLAKLALALMPVNCVWFKALNMSTRNSNFTVLTTAKILDSDMSRLLTGGLRTKNRADSAPSLPGCGGAKHEVSSCPYGSPLHPRPGLHVRAMRAFGVSVPVRFTEPIPGIVKSTVYGRPLVQRYTPEICQSFASRPSGLLRVTVGV